MAVHRKTLSSAAVALTFFLLQWSAAAGAEVDDTHGSVARTIPSAHGISVEKSVEHKEYRVLWPGHRILGGTVESITGDTIRVNTGELLPRFLSLREATEKGLSDLKKGDRLELAVNDQNLVVDYHLAGQETWHRIIRGHLAQPLPVGQEWAVIKTEGGKEEAFAVRPLARSKVAAIPMYAPAVFLLDEAGKVIDATFGTEQALQQRTAEWKRSPIKAPYQRVEGTIMKSPSWIIVKTEDGKEQLYQVRPHVQDRLAKTAAGQPVILMVDDENKVADIAIPPASKG
ncbi:hypothetical protein [Candidatus Nitrospira bockiana]